MAAMSLENAKKAVEDQLHARKFIDEHKAAIFQKLEECDRRVTVSTDQNHGAEGEDVLFIAECLPIMAGIVHLSSNQLIYRDAKDWAKGLLRDADPGFVLSTFMFLYLVDKGQEEYRNDPEKAQIWKRIHDRVQHFVQPGKPPQGQGAQAA